MQTGGSFGGVPVVAVKKVISAPVPKPILDPSSRLTPFEKLLNDYPQIRAYYNQLKEIRFVTSTGKLVFEAPLSPGAAEVLYNVLYKIKTYFNANKVSEIEALMVKFLNGNFNTEDQMFYSFDEFEVPRYKYNKQIESYFDKREIETGLYTCKKCQSKETVSEEKQTRARDEGETVRVICLTCGNAWRN